MKNKLTKFLNFPTIIFVSTLISSFSLGNIYYLTTQGPDFVRYRNYLDYFILDTADLKLEQGFVYFLFISFFTISRIGKYSIFNDSELSSLGNKTNFSYYNLSEFELEYSLAIQEGNFLIYLIGLLGLYKYLISLNFKKNKILLTLSVLNYLPILLMMRFTLKPEIFAFSLLPWILYSSELYKKENNLNYLLYGVFLTSITVTTKASIGVMIIIFLFLKFFKILKSLSLKEFALLIIVFCLVVSVLMVESYNATGLNILTRAEINEEFGQLEYDNKASGEFITNINIINLMKNPKNKYPESFLSITLLDTFDDYFNLYWNQDYSLLKIDRKQFIQTNSDNIFSFDRNIDTLFLPENYKFLSNFDYIRSQFSIIFSLIFYILSFYLIFKKNKNYKIFLGPIIGMVILLLSSFGVPENNFDPKVGDTVKVFYYGFLFSIAFSFLFISFLKNNNLINYSLAISAICIFIFILGFPKANNTYLDYSIKKVNEHTVICELNSIILNYMLIESNSIKCEDSNKVTVCTNLEDLSHQLDPKTITFEKNNNSTEYVDFDSCINLLSKKYQIKNFGYTIKNLPIFNFLTLIYYLIVIFQLSILENKKYKFSIKRMF